MDPVDSGYPTSRAEELRRLAREVAESCPAGIGREIALIGSVASGWADERSDVELVIFATDEPDRDRVLAWVHDELGANSVVLGEEVGGCHLIGSYEGVWLELQWRTLTATNELIDSVLTGGLVSRKELVWVNAIVGASALRTSGEIAGWQKRLSTYPHRLAEQIVAEATDFWKAPHRIEVPSVLADRGQVFSLVEWLQADIQDALRVLFAINEAWEPDWKWLRHNLARLELVPERLGERIDSIFLALDPRQAVVEALRIIEDVLALAATRFDVSLQLENVKEACRTRVRSEWGWRHSWAEQTERCAAVRPTRQ
jgi:hypothetical protein